MKTVFSLLFLSLTLPVVQAAGPCDPAVQAQPSSFVCQSKDLYYSVEIRTQTSGPRCPLEKRVELHTALIKVMKEDGNPVSEIKILPGYFTYYDASFPAKGYGSLTSPALGLDLKGCVSLRNGGLSAGN